MTESVDMIWQSMIALSVGIAAIIGAGSMIVKLLNPYRRLTRQVEKHSEILARDLARLDANDERDKMILKTLFALLENARTHNSTGMMEATSKELQDYLVKIS